MGDCRTSPYLNITNVLDLCFWFIFYLFLIYFDLLLFRVICAYLLDMHNSWKRHAHAHEIRDGTCLGRVEWGKTPMAGQTPTAFISRMVLFDQKYR